jgi:uncharacterized protein
MIIASQTIIRRGTTLGRLSQDLLTVFLSGILLVASSSANGSTMPKPWIPPVQMESAGPTGQRIETAKVIGNYYPVDSRTPAPAVLIFGGSEGGLSRTVTRHAQALQREGYATLHISWWRAPGQAERLEDIPLETFEAALAWLKKQPGVDGKRIAVFGWSRGTEAAQLLAIRHPEIRALVLGMPANAVWPGMDWDFTQPQPEHAWSSAGKALPAVDPNNLPSKPLVPWSDEEFRKYVDGLERRPESLIKIERVKASVLMICGEADRIWPSCPMARESLARAQLFGKRNISLFAYKDAGHMAYGAPDQASDPNFAAQVQLGGGNVEATASALRDSFEKTLLFLKEAL